MQVTSNEYIETREDEIAQMIIALEHLDRLRRLAEILYKKDSISTAYYRDMRDSVEYIANTVRMGKHNTAALRNGRRE